SGEGGAWGSGSTTCSPPQSDSKPAVSAARATRAAPSGYEQGPVVIENRPNLRGIAISSRTGLRDLLGAGRDRGQPTDYGAGTLGCGATCSHSSAQVPTYG